MKEDGDATRMDLVRVLSIAVEADGEVPAYEGKDTDELDGILEMIRLRKCDVAYRVPDDLDCQIGKHE